MKKIKIYISILIFIAILAITNKVNASLQLNELKFDVQINEDSSMDVIEYWDIDIEDTNTLYKFFKTDKSKFSDITNVKVIDITDGKNIKYIKDSYWQYHVSRNHYYGTENEKGNFEIGWGVGLDNRSDTRQYRIEYTVEDAITKYNDYAELYWQFVGNEFEVPAESVTGIIKLPQDALSKDNIRVWGHTEELNGEINVISTDTIQFNLEGYNTGNMIEVRVLFPTKMIEHSVRQENVNTLQTVIDEETKWAKEANNKRLIKSVGLTLAIVAITVVIDIVIIIKLRKYINKLKTLTKRYKPENNIEYYRDIPRDNATPGEACKLIKKSISKISSLEIGKVFSAGLLDLSLKGYIEFKINNDKKEKDNIAISLTKKDIGEKEKLGEEKVIYIFLKSINNRENEVTVKQLQKEIERDPQRIAKLVKKINNEISDGLEQNLLIDNNEKKEYNKYIGGQIIYFVCLIWGCVISAIILISITINIIIIISLLTAILLLITGLVTSIIITRRMNIFTQKGVNEIEEWRGLKKYMKDYSLLKEKEVPAIVVWEKYLVYATAFGIANKVIEQLKLVYPNFDDLSIINSTTLYVAMNTNFSSSFANAINTSISRTYSSATGGGGGFSGGGGGGRRPAEAEAVAKIMNHRGTLLK